MYVCMSVRPNKWYGVKCLECTLRKTKNIQRYCYTSDKEGIVGNIYQSVLQRALDYSLYTLRAMFITRARARTNP